MTDKVMILAAHPDDQVLGPGATIAKYNSDGIKVYSFVFSFGELAPIWIKPHLNKQRRKRESDKADQILGIEKTTYYGIPDTQIKQEIQKGEIPKKLKDFIRRHEIKKIFTHSTDDPHPDHRLLANLALEITEGKEIEIYSYNVWNPFNLKNSDKPKMYVDVSKTFKTKVKALKTFKSQFGVMLQLLPLTYFRAYFDGLKSGHRYAESFIKIK